MSTRQTRRRFLRSASLAGIACTILPRSSSAYGYTANEKLNVAVIGLGSRGTYLFNTFLRLENLVAICDANRNRLTEALKRQPAMRHYQDYRKLLDELQRQLDAVVIATPEHTHAIISTAAMKRGKHVFCEKPIAHDVLEARTLRQVAAQCKVATQMGNQGMATDSFRRTLELVLDGAVGEIREVHVWFVFGGSGPMQRPKDTPAVPDYIDWDLWLGPAPYRPFHPSYLSGWGAWRELGTGCLGGGGSHSINMAFKALRLGELWESKESEVRIRVETETSGPCPENFPHWQIVRYDIPARGPLPPARINWYNAAEEELKRQGIWQRLEKIAGRSLEWQDSWTPRSGSLLVGSKGIVHTNAHNSICELLPKGDFPNAGGPPQKLPRAGSHERDWLSACRGGAAAMSNFGHAGPAMELLMLGNIASLVGKPFQYDPLAGRIADNAEADRALRCAYREGWTL